MTLACTDSGAIAWPLRSVTGLDAVRARLLQRLHTVQGERPEDVTVGWALEVIEGQAVPRARAEAQLRAQLRADPAVLQIRSLTVADAGTARTATASLLVRTTDGLAELTLGVPLPYDTRGAPAWYLTSGILRRGPGPGWPR